MGKEGGKLEAIVQNYVGMTPADKGCNNWKEMQDKMVEEIKEVMNPYTQIAEATGLYEVNKPFNLWKDGNGNIYRLTKYGFRLYKKEMS